MGYEFKQFEIEKKILAPCFRYLPNREVMQRLIMRAASMKEDQSAEISYEQPGAASEESGGGISP